MPAEPKEWTAPRSGEPEKDARGGARGAPRRTGAIGHKGADAIVAGNTAESFDAAVEHGVDMIELDVLREQEGRLIVAHDFDDALRRRPMELDRGARSLPRAAAGQGRDRLRPEARRAARPSSPARSRAAACSSGPWSRPRRSRACASCASSSRTCGSAGPTRRRSATGPSTAGLSPRSRAGLAALRRRYPSILAKRGPDAGRQRRLGLPPDHHAEGGRGRPRDRRGADRLDGRRRDRMRELLEMGVDGICSNDPRLFEVVEGRPPPPSSNG